MSCCCCCCEGMCGGGGGGRGGCHGDGPTSPPPTTTTSPASLHFLISLTLHYSNVCTVHVSPPLMFQYPYVSPSKHIYPQITSPFITHFIILVFIEFHFTSWVFILLTRMKYMDRKKKTVIELFTLLTE